MANYNEISRRGLIKLNNDFDKGNDNALHNFMDESTEEYEAVRPFEEVAARLDEVTEVIKERKGIVSQSMMDRVNHVFDSMVSGLTDEISRCESVIDEQDDDDSYLNDNDDDDDEEENI